MRSHYSWWGRCFTLKPDFLINGHKRYFMELYAVFWASHYPEPPALQCLPMEQGSFPLLSESQRLRHCTTTAFGTITWKSVWSFRLLTSAVLNILCNKLLRLSKKRLSSVIIFWEDIQGWDRKWLKEIALLSTRLRYWVETSVRSSSFSFLHSQNTTLELRNVN